MVKVIFKHLKQNWYFLILLAVLVYIYSTRHLDRELVLGDFGITEGWITYYWDRGNQSDAGVGRQIGYKYKAGKKEYYRKVGTRAKFPECEELNKICLKKRFVVIYSKSDPSKSLIYFKQAADELKDSVLLKTKIQHFQ